MEGGDCEVAGRSSAVAFPDVQLYSRILYSDRATHTTDGVPPVPVPVPAPVLATPLVSHFITM